MRIGEIASSAEYRIDEQLQNLSICGVKFWFSNFKKFWKFFNFPISKIPKISEILQIYNLKHDNLPNWKILEFW